MYRATTSLPTPLSPVIKTFAGLSAARAAMASSSVMTGLATTKLGCSRVVPTRAWDVDDMTCMAAFYSPRARQPQDAAPWLTVPDIANQVPAINGRKLLINKGQTDLRRTTCDDRSSCDESGARVLVRTRLRSLCLEQRGFVPHRDGEVLDADDATRRQPDQLFDDVLEFADVTWPAISQKRAERTVREAQLPPGARDEVLHQSVNVF